MVKKKLTAILLATVMAFAVCAFSGCGYDGEDGFTEEVDSTRTQIYVFNFYGGFRNEWLQSAKKQFEELYKDYDGVDGKKGVQIMMDPRKQYFSSTGSVIKTGTNEVYFTEYMYFHGPYNGGAFLDITDWIEEPVTEHGDSRTIIDKLSSEQQAYYSRDGRYYALPHYESYEGIVYNKDIWKSKGFYFSHSERNNPDLYSRFTSDMNDLSAGPDGEKGTADDGLPATYADLVDLCTYINANGVIPFIWSGEHYIEYVAGVLNALVADYEGEEMRLMYELDGTATTLVDKDGNKLPDQTITEQTAYKIANMEGRREALKLVEKLVHTTEWQAEGAFNSALSHQSAQSRYLSSGYDGNKQIAMLIDGTWWEGEASQTFQDVADWYRAPSKNERSFGWMPLPKANTQKLGKQTYFDPTQGMCFVKSTLAEEKKDIVKKFIRFMYSDKMLSEFTRITSAAKALDYDVSPEDEAQMTDFAKDLWTQRKNAKTIVYPISNAPLFVNNQGSFDRSMVMGVRINGKDYETAVQAFHEIPTLTAQQAFEGMLDYQKRWFDITLKK